MAPSSEESTHAVGMRRSPRTPQKPEVKTAPQPPQQDRGKLPITAPRPASPPLTPPSDQSSLSQSQSSRRSVSPSHPPKKPFSLVTEVPSKTFKLVKNGVVQSINQATAVTSTSTGSPDSAPSSQKGPISVSFIPVEDVDGGAMVRASAAGGVTAVTDGRPTYIVQIGDHRPSGASSGSRGSGASSGSRGTGVSPFNHTNNGPTPCVFRLTSPTSPKKQPGMVEQPPTASPKFTLNKVLQNGHFTEAQLANRPALAMTADLQSPRTSSGSGISSSPVSAEAVLKQQPPPTKVIKRPPGYAVTIRPGQKYDASPAPVNAVANMAKKVPAVAAVSVPVGPVVILRQDVVPLLTTVSPNTDWAYLVAAYEASGLNARCSKDKEKKLLKEFENIRGIYEDQQVLWRILPVGEALDLPGLSPAQFGDLLSLGRFIEVLQHANKTVRSKKRHVDLNFLLSAVTMPDGNVGKYLFLVNWLVWAFDESKSTSSSLKIPAEFGTSIQTVETDPVLACETLRQYLALLVEQRKVHGVDEKVAALLKKVKTMDIALLTVAERTDFLALAHAALLHNTDFFSSLMHRLDTEYSQTIIQRKTSIEAIAVKTNILRGMETELRQFDSREKFTRLEEREKTRITDDIKSLTKDIESIKEDRKEAEADAEKTLQMMSMGCHSEPLGYDRDFNRYWTFPELSPDIFVESGWATSPASHFPTPVAHAVPERPKILGNFIFLDRFSELYYLKDNGTHEKCNARPIGPPPVAPNTWRVLKPADVQSLVENLNQMGIREGALLTKVKAWLAKQTKDTEPNASRPAPVIAESALEILSELFVKIAGDLIENQLLEGEVQPDWEAKLKSQTLSDVKSTIVSIHLLIIPQFIRNEFQSARSVGQTWREAVLETDSVSRLYFLVKVLDKSVCWERGSAKENCKSCGKSLRRAKTRRCGDCLAIFHATNGCMAFEGKRCGVCVGTTTAEEAGRKLFSYREVEEGGGESKSPPDEGQAPFVTRGTKRKASLDGSVHSDSGHSYKHKLRNKKDGSD